MAGTEYQLMCEAKDPNDKLVGKGVVWRTVRHPPYNGTCDIQFSSEVGTTCKYFGNCSPIKRRRA